MNQICNTTKNIFYKYFISIRSFEVDLHQCVAFDKDEKGKLLVPDTNPQWPKRKKGGRIDFCMTSVQTQSQ